MTTHHISISEEGDRRTRPDTLVYCTECDRHVFRRGRYDHAGTVLSKNEGKRGRC